MLEEGVAWHRTQCIVGDACRLGEASESGKGQQRCYAEVGRDVEIEVDPAVVMEEEIADRIGALDGVRIGDVGREEGGIVCLNEGERIVICPELSSSAFDEDLPLADMVEGTMYS